MKARPYRKSLRLDPDIAKFSEEPSELAGAVLEQHRRIVVLETDLHQLRQRIQPRDAVVDLKDRLSSRPQDAVALVHERLRTRCVLDDAVRVDEIERVIRERQSLAVG